MTKKKKQPLIQRAHINEMTSQSSCLLAEQTQELLCRKHPGLSKGLQFPMENNAPLLPFLPVQIKYPQLGQLPPLHSPTKSWQFQYFLLSSHRLNHATLTLPHLVFMEWHSLVHQVQSFLFWDVLVHSKTFRDGHSTNESF